MLTKNTRFKVIQIQIVNADWLLPAAHGNQFACQPHTHTRVISPPTLSFTWICFASWTKVLFTSSLTQNGTEPSCMWDGRLTPQWWCDFISAHTATVSNHWQIYHNRVKDFSECYNEAWNKVNDKIGFNCRRDITNSGRTREMLIGCSVWQWLSKTIDNMLLLAC